MEATIFKHIKRRVLRILLLPLKKSLKISVSPTLKYFDIQIARVDNNEHRFKQVPCKRYDGTGNESDKVCLLIVIHDAEVLNLLLIEQYLPLHMSSICNCITKKGYAHNYFAKIKSIAFYFLMT